MDHGENLILMAKTDLQSRLSQLKAVCIILKNDLDYVINEINSGKDACQMGLNPWGKVLQKGSEIDRLHGEVKTLQDMIYRIKKLRELGKSDQPQFFFPPEKPHN